MPLNDSPQNYKKPDEPGKGTLVKRFAAAVLAIAIGSAVIQSVTSDNDAAAEKEKISYSTFIQNVKEGKVKSLKTGFDERGRSLLRGETTEAKPFHVYPMSDPSLVDRLQEGKVTFEKEPDPVPNPFTGFLINMLPIAALIGAMVWLAKKQMGGSGGVFSMKNSKAKLLTPDQKKVRFADVAGVEEAKDDLMETVAYLKNPDKFSKMGARSPKGILLTGGPGTGKTLLAKAVAGESGVPFYSISGSDFVEMFVGTGAARVRDMFDQAKKNAPCIIFIDEIDAVGRQRSSGHGLGGGHDEREQTLNQLLVEMDGFDESNSSIVVIAATNRPEVLDKALLRPGRFDRNVVVPNPDIMGREQILNVHMKKIKLESDVNVRAIASGTTGFSGAELANLVNEAALAAVRRGGTDVSMRDFENAKHKILMGAVRKLLMSEEGRRITAHHEAGHAIVGIYTKSDPVTMVSIVPRGRALGVTLQEPNEDRYSISKEEMEDRIAMFHAGRVAEINLGGPKAVTTGASNDIDRATAYARAMVTEDGMSDTLGVVRYHAPDANTGYPVTHAPETEREIDLEIKRIMDEGVARAKAIIEDHKEEFLNLADALMKYETVAGADEIAKAMRGEPLPNREPVVRNANDNGQTAPSSIAQAKTLSL